MENNMTNPFKPTPERFRYAVDTAIAEAKDSAPHRKRLSKAAKIAIAAALTLTLIPSAIFGASKIISSLNAEKVGNYGVKLTATADPEASYPKYVKMHINIPEGFAEVPGTDGMKYYNLNAEQPYTDGFSLCPIRPTASNPAEVVPYSDGFEEAVIAGHTAYRIKNAENNDGFDRTYIWYEEMNVLLLIYHEDVTEKQLVDFVKGISFTEGSATDHTDLSTPDNILDKNNEVQDQAYTYNNDYIEKPLDTEVTFGEYGADDNAVTTPLVSTRVADVRVIDNISELDSENINPLFPIHNIADENGDLLPATREIRKYGDGINTNDEVLNREQIAQKIVLIDIDCANLTDQDKVFYVPWQLSAMRKAPDGSFTPSEIYENDDTVAATQLYLSEIFYLSDHGDGKAFYSTTLSPNETKTITIGFIADADKLDELYLSCCPSADEVYSPAYPTENPYTYFLMKVL